MQKRTTEEGGGYRIPHQRLREVLFYVYLKEEDPALQPESLRRWLALPPTEELEGALVQIAEDLWEADRCKDLAVFFRGSKHEFLKEQSAEEKFLSQKKLLAEWDKPIGVRAVERLLARRVELREAPLTLHSRLQRLWKNLDKESALRHIRKIVFYGVPGRVEGLPYTDQLRALWETAQPLLEFARKKTPENSDLARDLVVSYDRMARVSEGLGNEEGRRWFARGQDPLRQLKAEGRLPDKGVEEYLNWLEKVL